MEDVRLSYNDFIVYLGIANTILGVLFGVFPLVVGLKTGDRKFAYIGFLASLVGGFLLSVFLAFPLALIFTILALRPVRSQTIEEAATSPAA